MAVNLESKNIQLLEELIKTQKAANENMTTGFDALKNSGGKLEKFASVAQVVDTLNTKKEGVKDRKQGEKYHKEDVKSGKKQDEKTDKAQDTRETVGEGAEGRGTGQSGSLSNIARAAFAIDVSTLGQIEHLKHLEEHTKEVIKQTKEPPSGFKKFTLAADKIAAATLAKKLAEQPESTREKDQAAALKRQEDEARATNIGISTLNFLSRSRIDSLDEIAKKIEEQQAIMSNTAIDIENVGKSLMESKEYRKQALELAKLEKTQAKRSGSKSAEEAAKKKISEIKDRTLLKNIAKFTGGMWGAAKGAAKAITGKLPNMSSLLMMGVAGAMLALMNNNNWVKFKETMLEVASAIGKWYDETFKPAFDVFWKFLEENTFPAIWEGIKKQFDILGDFFDNVSSFFTNLLEGNFWEATKDFGAILMNIVEMIDNAIKTILGSIGLNFEGSVLDAAKRFFGDIIQKVKDTFTSVIEAATSWLSKTDKDNIPTETFGMAGADIAEPVKKAFKRMGQGWRLGQGLGGLGAPMAGFAEARETAERVSEMRSDRLRNLERQAAKLALATPDRPGGDIEGRRESKLQKILRQANEATKAKAVIETQKEIEMAKKLKERSAVELNTHHTNVSRAGDSSVSVQNTGLQNPQASVRMLSNSLGTSVYGGP